MRAAARGMRLQATARRPARDAPTTTAEDQLIGHLLYGHQLLLPVPDIDRTELLLVVGGNPMASNGSLWTVPDFPQLKNATLVIIVFVIIVALIIWLMDLSVRGILGVIMDLFA